MSNIAVLTWERWINPESCTPKREITLADLKEKQCHGNTLFIIPVNYGNANVITLSIINHIYVCSSIDLFMKVYRVHYN